MRLIDVDKIIITRQEYVGALTLKERLRRLLESQPTVEAIPMGWISEYSRRPLSNADYWAIMRMVTAWEKENENR